MSHIFSFTDLIEKMKYPKSGESLVSILHASHALCDILM